MTDTEDTPGPEPPHNDQPSQRTPYRVRDGKGRFRRSIAAAGRDAQVLDLYERGYSYRKIGIELDIDPAHAFRIVQNTLREIIEEPAQRARQRWLDRLNNAYDMALEVAETEHVKVSDGKIIRVRVLDDDGMPIIIDHNQNTGEPIYLEADLIDDGPVLQAIDRMEKVARRVAAMEGYDAETKVNLSGDVTYQVKGVPDDDV